MPLTYPFQEHALQYEEWFEKHQAAYQSELEAIRKKLPRRGKGLEIGVGTGRFAAPLGIKTGVDPSPRMRRMAEEKGVRTVDGVAEKLPFPDSCFDFALMITTICFVDDPEKAFKEARRVLRPGGCLVIGFIDKQSRIGREYRKKKEESVFYREARFYSVEEVVSLLEKTGFQDLAFSQTLFHSLENTSQVEPVRKGHGKGSFVVIKAVKPGEDG